jgi:hypothetical protein
MIGWMGTCPFGTETELLRPEALIVVNKLSIKGRRLSAFHNARLREWNREGKLDTRLAN